MREKFFGVDSPLEREFIEATFSEEDVKEYVKLAQMMYDNLMTIGAIQTTLDKSRRNADEINQELVDKVVGLTYMKDKYVEENDTALELMRAIESKYSIRKENENEN